ncbi:hypothetical protein AQUCO_04900043v1 [Aquilegia coerulea]|uniref:Uncharacterized protein n=1 Tax=Aquilegia coerulea TaxID=218851 RepID=A0A2G5CKW0_AQUCA|nr:hypothetical protein AQUCO_04900043v1 [Aquilegia coerulea]
MCYKIPHVYVIFTTKSRKITRSWCANKKAYEKYRQIKTLAEHDLQFHFLVLGSLSNNKTTQFTKGLYSNEII